MRKVQTEGRGKSFLYLLLQSRSQGEPRWKLGDTYFAAPCSIFLASYNSPLRTELVRKARIGGGTESTMVGMFLCF
jgi:hypothetical protein